MAERHEGAQAAIQSVVMYLFETYKEEGGEAYASRLVASHLHALADTFAQPVSDSDNQSLRDAAYKAYKMAYNEKDRSGKWLSVYQWLAPFFE